MASGEETSTRFICSEVPVHSLEALELVNCHHKGLASLRSLDLGTQFYAYSLLRK
jgi:hypothetical protein